jgi:hypothetical protein
MSCAGNNERDEDSIVSIMEEETDSLTHNM